MQDKEKPDRYVIARLVEATGKSTEECVKVYLQHDYLYDPALNALLQEDPVRANLIPEPPPTVHIPLILTDGTQLREGMRVEEFGPLRTYHPPHRAGNRTAYRAMRLCERIAQGIKERGDDVERVPVKDLKAGEVLYENGYGLSRQVRILTTPRRVDNGWRCLAEDVHKKFELFENDDYPQYAPHITRSAIYATIEVLPLTEV